MTKTRARLAELIRWQVPEAVLLDSIESRREGYVLELVTLQIGEKPVRGIITKPLEQNGQGPAILYAHSHGGNYDIGAEELIRGREYLLDGPGPALARAGYVTLCIDMPCFGKRNTVSEGSASKALLWYGKSLLGQMLNDEAAALSYLISREDVDPNRIGALGMSMGSTLSYFHAALDERIAVVAHLCCFANQKEMIASGAHDGHGIYMVVPGLLEEFDAGQVAALIAPRPQMVCIGEEDSLTPRDAFKAAWVELEAAYLGKPEALDLLIEPGVGHMETPQMRESVMWFFERYLKAVESR
jgi:dienelactone hydrolase